MKKAGKKPKQDVAEGSVTPDVNVSKVHDDGHEKEWHIYRGKEMIGYVIKNQPEFNASNMEWRFYLIGRKFDTSGFIEDCAKALPK